MITGIYDDKLLPLIKEGKATTKRVSNVEPGEGGWIATMLDGTKLGPFESRAEALDEEVNYLNQVLFGGVSK